MKCVEQVVCVAQCGVCVLIHVSRVFKYECTVVYVCLYSALRSEVRQNHQSICQRVSG